MMYNVDYFIKKFKAIPAKKWFKGWFANKNNTAFCALGHCGASSKGGTAESSALATMFQRNNFSVVAANDGEDKRKYRQKTPKKRVLAALKRIKKLSTAQA